MDALKMTLRRMALAAIVVWAAPARAQFPASFTNLQVLPKDTPPKELQSMMRNFAFALGVRCPYCHVEKSDGTKHSMDFAADDKEAKKTARVMMQMVAAMNKDYISKLPETPPIPVQCVTCHRGLTEPRTLNSVLAETIAQKGIDAGISQYNELRKKYYGSGQYDFGETTLNQLAESLLAQDKNKEALAITELNFSENHPDSVWSYHMLATAHEANGQNDKALADYRKVLELHPDDDWAKEQIRALSSPK